MERGANVTRPSTLTPPLTFHVLSGADELIALDFANMVWPRSATWPVPHSEYGRKIFPSPWLLRVAAPGAGNSYHYKCLTCPDEATAKRLGRFTGTIANSTQVKFSFKECAKLGSTLQHIAALDFLHGSCSSSDGYTLDNEHQTQAFHFGRTGIYMFRS